MRGNTMLERFKVTLKEKGQGLIEYALILAFVAGIAMMLFSGNGNLKDTLISTFSETARILAGICNDKAKNYADYFRSWRDLSLADLAAQDSNERLLADQMALDIIAKAFIGKDFEEVKDLMRTYTRGENLINIEKFDPKDGLNGYSESTLVPLSFELVQEADGSYYTWLQTEENRNLVSQVLASDAQIIGRDDTALKRTRVEDGIFYSDAMISSDGNPLRTVNLRLHYTDGKVDSVDIAARQGKWNGTSIDNLNLNVTNSGYSVNDRDYVLHPEWH